VYYEANSIISYLGTHPDLDVSKKNGKGFNQIEQLRLLGYKELAERIQSQRPEIQARKFQIKERNYDQKTAEYPNGTPIISFVPVIRKGEVKSFLMGDEYKVLVTLTKPFSIMSTQTTQKAWEEVADLSRQYLGISDIKAKPAHFQGDNRPVERVSYEDVISWNQALNNLSKMDDENVQNSLKQLFPGHQKGDVYRLPTEAEREFVQRNQGFAEGEYSFGNSKKKINNSAVYSSNSGNQTQPVGSKDPVLVNGRPVYDIQGNVWEWVGDWYGSNLSGGLDPQGPSAGSSRVFRGGSWYNVAQNLRSWFRDYYWPGIRDRYLGFRLVRTRP
jgi:formylglycine-generating enzyme required for sulfatase activity